MRKLSSLGDESAQFENIDWFRCGENRDLSESNQFFVQDMIQIATKWRNYVMKTSNKKEKKSAINI